MFPQNNLPAMLNALKSNPAAFLGKQGVQLPPGMTDPNAILNQMIHSGRYSQAAINQAYEQARRMGFKK